MTLGERIKYYRSHYLITSKQLAEIIGVNHTTVRQYETDKLQPSAETIVRLANTFGVNTLALTDDLSGFRLETVGDLAGMILYLINKGLITIDGERGENNLIKQDTASIKFSSFLSSVFSVTLHGKEENLPDLGLKLKNSKALDKLLIWEKARFLHNKISEMAERDNAQADQRVIEVLAGLEMEMETSALDMQMILDCIDTSSGKTVRIPLAANLERNANTAADAAASLLEEFQRDQGGGATEPRRKNKK